MQVLSVLSMILLKRTTCQTKKIFAVFFTSYLLNTKTVFVTTFAYNFIQISQGPMS